MKKLMIINGPNLNLLGIREPDVYGSTSYDDLISALELEFSYIRLKCVQSNFEGDIINYIHEAVLKNYDGIVINPGGFSHTSVAILDALLIFKGVKVEVHISDVFGRDDFRSNLITAKGCDHMICGRGIKGYFDAIKQVLIS